jgi:hypothetical protein
MAAVARQQAIVKKTIHGLRRWVVSETAPKSGIERIPIADTNPFATANFVFDTPRSATIHAEKNSVVMFIEKIVLEKSYSAQLHLSFAGARGGLRSPAAVSGELLTAMVCMNEKVGGAVG